MVFTDNGSRPYDVSNDVMKSAVLKISTDLWNGAVGRAGVKCLISTVWFYV